MSLLNLGYLLDWILNEENIETRQRTYDVFCTLRRKNKMCIWNFGQINFGSIQDHILDSVLSGTQHLSHPEHTAYRKMNFVHTMNTCT